MNISPIQITVKLTQPRAWQTASWSARASKISFATCDSVSIMILYVREQDSFPSVPQPMRCPDWQLCQCFSCFILVQVFAGFKFLYIQTGRPSEISKHITRRKIILRSELNFAYSHYIQCPYYFAGTHCFRSLCCENLLM